MFSTWPRLTWRREGDVDPSRMPDLQVRLGNAGRIDETVSLRVVGSLKSTLGRLTLGRIEGNIMPAEITFAPFLNGEVTAAIVRQQVKTILASRQFVNAERLG